MPGRTNHQGDRTDRLVKRQKLCWQHSTSAAVAEAVHAQQCQSSYQRWRTAQKEQPHAGRLEKSIQARQPRQTIQLQPQPALQTSVHSTQQKESIVNKCGGRARPRSSWHFHPAHQLQYLAKSEEQRSPCTHGMPAAQLQPGLWPAW
jgi:hypothetical protein